MLPTTNRLQLRTGRSQRRIDAPPETMDPSPLTRLAQIAAWLVKGLLFLLLLGLAIKNSDAVTLRYYLGLEWRAPMALMLFVFFVAGALMGLLAMLSPWVRQRSEIRRLRAELAQGPARDATDA
jgi:uncharacterized integral membrane protein